MTISFPLLKLMGPKIPVFLIGKNLKKFKQKMRKRNAYIPQKRRTCVFSFKARIKSLLLLLLGYQFQESQGILKLETLAFHSDQI